MKVSAARAVAWSWAARVEGELRALGLPPEMLHTLEGTDAERGARDAMVDYAADARVARVAVRHPVVARWLAGDPRRGATLLAMAVYGAINRARADLTKAEECAAMGPDGLEAFVAYGMAKCDRYGIETEYDVGRYCDLMLLLTRDFDEDPNVPWAQDILTSPGFDGRVKVDQLMERTETLCQDMCDAIDAIEE